MDVLDGRPVWSLSDGELMPAFDAVDAEIIRLQNLRLQLIASIEDTGHAQELGARDAVELVSFRHRRDRAEAWRDVRLARALPRYTAVATALADGIEIPTAPAPHGSDHDHPAAPGEVAATGDVLAAREAAGAGEVTGTGDVAGAVEGADAEGAVKDARAGEAAGAAEVTGAGEVTETGEMPDAVEVTETGDVAGAAEAGGRADAAGAGEAAGAAGVGDEGVRVVRPMQAAHAVAIVFELERVRSRVPVDVLDVAEEQLVQLAAHLAPAELRAAAKEICNLLDSDGPEPEEKKAYERESLTLTNADKGVKFKGYLANENAELLRAVIHAGARPHKTAAGEQDPRPREKRQADALSTALTIAAAAWDTNSSCVQGGEQNADNPFGMANKASSSSTPAPSNAAPSASTPSSSANASSSSGASSSANASSSMNASSSANSWPAANSSPATSSSSGQGVRVPGYGAKANITVTIDLEDLKAATADAIGRTVYSGGLSAATIRRLACDANVIPVVLGSNSEPLDVGRSERLVTQRCAAP